MASSVKTASPTGRADVPDAVSEVMCYRRAARRLVRGPGDYSTKLIAIVTLADKARKECALPRWVQMAIWRESQTFIETGKLLESPPSSDPVINTLSHLRRRGVQRCSECRRPIPPAAVLDRWAETVFRSSVEHAFAEGAVA